MKLSTRCGLGYFVEQQQSEGVELFRLTLLLLISLLSSFYCIHVFSKLHSFYWIIFSKYLDLPCMSQLS